MPKEFMCVAPRKLEWREYAEPKLGKGEIRIRSEFAAAKHGTETIYYKGLGQTRGYFDYELGLFIPHKPNRRNNCCWSFCGAF